MTLTLPAVRGRMTQDAPLAEKSWFGVGGNAEFLFKPADLADLQQFLAECPPEIPITSIGTTSNLLIRDGGIRGVVIRLGGAFAELEAHGDTIHAGAAALDASVAQFAQQNALAGLEFLYTIPGSLGGALKMNAGCYGREVKDVLVTADAVDRNGRLHTLRLDDMGFSYRHSSVPEDFIFVGATLKGTPDDPDKITARMKEQQQQRDATQPVRVKTGGSTFANPEGYKAWELVDKVGLRGVEMNGAMFSAKHTNFLINTGGATAGALEDLGEEARRRVKEQFSVDLRWEIKRVGERA
jgi:UDP-N-acetylmuramate dehydrogenase